MDPLSITASVIAIVQAVNKTVSICLSFRAALKESPARLVRLIDETRNLRDILEALQLALDTSTSIPSGTRGVAIYEKVWQSIQHIVPQCQSIMDELDERLQKPAPAALKSSHTMEKAATAIRWMYIEPQIKAYLERIERCKSQLILGLSLHQSALLLDVRTVTISWQEKIEASNSRIEDQLDTISAATTAEHEIIKWLSPINFIRSHLDIVDQHQPGTSNWITSCDEFKKWYEGDTRLLWLNGGPGTGKTQLLAYLVQYLTTDVSSRPGQCTVAHVYCDFRDSESLEPSNILGSVVAQCCMSSATISDSIRTAFQASRSSGYDNHPPLALLKESITRILENHTLFILIDGLDESPQTVYMGKVIHNVLSEDVNLHAKVLVTGRETENLVEVFGGALQLRLIDYRDEVHQDVETYIRSQLQSDKRLQWLHEDIKQHISESLLKDPNAMFRLIQCQLDTISPLRSVKAIRQAMNTLPIGLENTYSRIISSIPQHALSSVHDALQWLCFSFMPLSLVELHEVLAVEVGSARMDHEAKLCSPMDILALGNSLFDVTTSGHVHLAHLSVRDYLLAPQQGADRGSNLVKFETGNSHRTLAQLCLTYLLLDDLSVGPADSADSYAQRLHLYPFLKYAASAWPYHVNCSMSSTSFDVEAIPETIDAGLSEMVLDFFSPRRRANFMTWVQVINAPYSFKWDIYPRHATALYYAASFGLENIVERLISSSDFSTSDLNAPGSRYGGTPVHAAAYRQHTRALRVLLKAGASAAKADFNGITPLHSAAATGDLRIIDMLLAHASLDGKTNAKDNLGGTPYDWAVGAGYLEAAQLLSPKKSPEANTGKSPATCVGPQGQAKLPDREIGGDGSVSPRLGPISLDQPTSHYFPDFYSKRSGLDSSIVVGFSTGQQVGKDEVPKTSP